MPLELATAHRMWRDLNPGYEYEVLYLDLVLARHYLAMHCHPSFLCAAFNCFQAFTSKSDLLWMALLYRKGG